VGVNPLATVAAVVLFASLAGNALLWSITMEQRDVVTKVKASRDQAFDAAMNCGRAIESLTDAATLQKAQAEAVIRAAQVATGKANARAEAERTRAQAVPGDACASAQVETREWLQARRSP
jgi:hypothetical protein